MEQNIVKLQISNEYIQGSGVSVGAVGSHDDVLLEMDFRPSAVWAGTTRRAIFANALGENRTVIVLTTNLLEEGQGEIYLVPVPQQAKDVAGECFLTVEGFVTDGNGKEIVRCVTEEARFRVLPSKLYTNDSAPVTPSQAEQLQAEIDSIKTTIVNAGISERNAKASEEAAENSKNAAEKAANSAETNKNLSADFAQSASVSASNASESEQAAQAAKSVAESAKTSAEESAASALASKQAAEVSEKNAASSESAAESSADAAAVSASAALSSKRNAKSSENIAKASETAAKSSETAAKNSEISAQEWAEFAQAQAESVTVPAAEGVYNVVLQDRAVMSDRYALIVENGVLKLLGVKNTVDAATPTLIDTTSGTGWKLAVENGRLLIEEV